MTWIAFLNNVLKECDELYIISHIVSSQWIFIITGDSKSFVGNIPLKDIFLLCVAQNHCVSKIGVIPP